MLAVSIVLFFICVFLSMMMALFDQDKKSDTKKEKIPLCKY